MAKVRDVVGLYMAPPDRALVLCVDEKSQIQVVDRSHPLLPMRPAQAARRTHDDTHHLRRNKCFADAAEFRRFLHLIEDAVPPRLDVNLVMDKYATHKRRRIRDWLAKRLRWNVHLAPTSASWLNQLERFFALITEEQIRRGVHQTPCKPRLADNEKDFWFRTFRTLATGVPAGRANAWSKYCTASGGMRRAEETSQ